MKIRITELLDDYYDDTVKLEEPVLPAETQPAAPNKRPGRMQKPLLAAATLMLVVTGTVALGLCFQSKTPGGGALAAGETSASSVEEAATPTPETAEEEATPEAMEVSATPEYDEEAETAEEFVTVEYPDTTLLSYAQQGDQLYFTVTLSPVSAEMAEVPPVATDIATDTGIDSISLTADSYDAGKETLYLSGSATLSQAGTYLSFTIILSQDGQAVVAGIPDSMIEFTALENYLFVENQNCIYEFPLESSDEAARVTRMEIRPDSVTFLYDFPTQGSTQESLLLYAMDWSAALAESLQNNSIQFIYKDGTAATDILGLSWDVTTEIVDEVGTDSAIATAELTIDWGEDAIDPTKIAELAFNSSSIMVYDWSCYEGEITAEDPNGDGFLTVDLDLSSEYGTLTRFVLDLTTNQYTWYWDCPEARAMAEEAGGDLSTVLGNEDFDAVFIPATNSLLEAYLLDVSILCTDGTYMKIGSGELIGCTDDLFMMYDHLLMTLEGSDLALNGREPEALVINGVQYDFE